MPITVPTENTIRFLEIYVKSGDDKNRIEFKNSRRVHLVNS